MRSRDIKRSNLNSDGRNSNGRLGKCSYCGETIYWVDDPVSGWKPFESYVAGNCNPGEWVFHICDSHRRARLGQR